MNSWNDIDLDSYSSLVLPTSKMFCGDNFAESCSMYNNVTNSTKYSEWNCIDTTSTCWINYDDNTNNGDDTNWALIIGLSVGAFFLLLIALCIGLYLRKDEEAFADKYDQQVVENKKRYDKDHVKGDNEEEIDNLKTPLSSSRNVSQQIVESMTDINVDQDVNSESFKEYKKMMQSVFYTFAGYQPWAKKRGLYLHKNELQTFLDIVNIYDDVNDVLKLIDSIDVEDGKITLNEWMDYFCSKEVNPSIFQIKHHIESQITWSLLCKALRIFSIVDEDHTGKLEYGEFRKFGSSIGLNEEETEILWNTMDTNNSGSIDIMELFEWFRLRLHQQTGRITKSRMPSLQFVKSDLEDLREFRYSAKKLDIDEKQQDQ